MQGGSGEPSLTLIVVVVVIRADNHVSVPVLIVLILVLKLHSHTNLAAFREGRGAGELGIIITTLSRASSKSHPQ